MCRNTTHFKNITVVHDFNAGDPIFDFPIDLNFTPDTVVVKLISYAGDSDPTLKDDLVYMIRCRELGNEIIASVIDGTSVAPNIAFDCRNAPINTPWRFSAYGFNGDIETSMTGVLALHLEFTKHD